MHNALTAWADVAAHPSLRGKTLTFRNIHGGYNFRGPLVGILVDAFHGAVEFLMKAGELEMQLAGSPEGCWHSAGNRGETLAVRVPENTILEFTPELVRYSFSDGRRITICRLRPRHGAPCFCDLSPQGDALRRDRA